MPHPIDLAHRARAPRAVIDIAVTAMLSVMLNATACTSATDPGRAGVPVVGSWDYVAAQTSPAPTDVRGVLAFTSQSGAMVGGSLDVVETDARGQQRRLAGPVSGRTVDSTTVDMEFGLDLVSRRHVGVVRGDSLNGTWVEIPRAGGSVGASGTFRAKRRR